MSIAAFMLTCPDRANVCAGTRERLLATDWPEPPTLVVDDAESGRRQDRQERAARRLLERAVAECSDAELLLFLEDDLDFNRHLHHNLLHWPPVRELAPGGPFFASLYNPGIGGRPTDCTRTCLEIEAAAVYGSQAFLLSSTTARYVVEHWEEVAGMQDIKMSRLAARLGPMLYHRPSLVQHVGAPSTWGGPDHVARDFDIDWRAPAPSCGPDEPRPETLDAGPEAELSVALERMREVPGWLDDDEARVLFTAAARAAGGTIVEVGSMWGRSTVVLGTAAQGRRAHVYAIDPHEGVVTALDGGTMRFEPTWEVFCDALDAAGVADVVTPIRAPSYETAWSGPIDLLFLDALHDYTSVRRDVTHFLPAISRRGQLAFHDYGTHFPGVKACVDEMLTQPDWRLAGIAGCLVVIERR